LIIDLLHGYIL